MQLADMIVPGILGVGSKVPDKILTNDDLEKMVDTSDEWITSRTGIKERRIAHEDELSSDYGAAAALSALKRANITPEELDLIIVATLTPDMFCPPTACIVQRKIGATKAAAFDLSAACSGFVYGLDMASHGIRTGAYKHVLVIGVDLLSRVTDYTDRTTCVLFGDGAGAAVLGPVQSGGILSTYLGADGFSGDKLTVPTNRDGSGEGCYIQMEGQDVFKFAVRVMPEAAQEVLERGGIHAADVDLFIPHQANHRIIDAAAKRLGITEEGKVFSNVASYGNTSAASIPLALDEAISEKRVKKGDRIVLVGFGGGLTWAAALIEWSGEGASRE